MRNLAVRGSRRTSGQCWCSKCGVGRIWMSGEATRILVMVDGLPVGGTERQVVALLKGLQGNGRFRAFLAVLDRGGQLEAEAVQFSAGLCAVRRVSRLDIMPAFAAIREAKRAGAQLIHTFGWMSGVAGLVAARALRRPIINGSIRGTPPVLRVRERLSRWCALRSNVIVANSTAGLEAYGVGGHPKARVIANGLDFTRFANVQPEAYDRPTICMVANFNQYKDHETVVRALPLIRQVVPQAQLVFVGNDCGTMATTRALVGQLGLDAAVRFVTHVTQPEPVVAGSDVCVLMSPEGEGLSNAVLEYMVQGKA
ncbi:MAG: glycosyltransferase, partial [Gaiellaceae bacterium]